MIAALFVETDGVYSNLDQVEIWDKIKDAMTYPGPFPVVAHPPCERWGRYWSGGPSAKVRRKLGDDGGRFASAIRSVREFGGVLEHPEASHAWGAFCLIKPPKQGGWIPAGDGVGYTCCVEQGNYGHRARKATWLYAVRAELPELIWGPSQNKSRLDGGFHSTEERRVARGKGLVASTRLTKRERLATPIQFRDMLIRMADSARYSNGST